MNINHSGLGRIRTIATPENYLGAKESVVKEQLKHRHPLSTTQNIAWGFFAIAMNKEIYTCNRLSSRGLEAWCIHLKPRVSLPFLSKSLRPGKPGMTRQTLTSQSHKTLNLSKLKRRLVKD